MVDARRLERFETGWGFIAALDQSGGSTPKALRQYGVDETRYADEGAMFDLIHEARTRVMTSRAFTGDRILGAILFEGTLDRNVDGRDVVDYLWAGKGILPFLKIDRGVEEERDGVRPMREIPGLEDTLARAAERGVFGTKERSVIHRADRAGIRRIVEQQFELGERVLAAGLMPILEPEVDITAPDRAEIEALLREEILASLAGLGERRIALKLSIPERDGFYGDLIAHPNVARVVALSGGYSREQANERLSRNPGLIASFSRALLDGLHEGQGQDEFDRVLDESIESIHRASVGPR